MIAAVMVMGAVACGDSRDFEALARQYVERNKVEFVESIVDVSIQQTPELAVVGVRTLVEG